jgi:hypothetical protein
MARFKVEVASRDRRGSTSDARSFRITSAEMIVQVDLCFARRKPLLKVIDLGRATQGTGRHRVVTFYCDAWLADRAAKSRHTARA